MATAVVRQQLGARSLADALAAAAAAGAPVILEGAALPLWLSPINLEPTVPTLHGVYVADNPRFGPYFDARRPLGRAAASVRPRHAYVEANTSTAAFFATAAPPHRYYSAELDRDLPARLQEMLEPLVASLVSLYPQHSSANLWLGRAGVVAPCHYDGYHNAFAHLHGRKRLRLAPPSAAALVQPFPFLHPSHGQCQAHTLPPDASVDADLHPGDVLYLPPLWFHEATALSDAVVSINGWSDCDEARVAAELFALPRPKRAAAATATRLTGLLRALSDRTLGDAAALGRRVWAERYAPLVAIAELPAPPLSPPLDCAAAPPDDERAEYARAAAASAARLPEATRGVWVGNLAEALAAEAVGAANVAAYLQALDACEAPRAHSDSGQRDEL